jgi:hypothetical protein
MKAVTAQLKMTFGFDLQPMSAFDPTQSRHSQLRPAITKSATFFDFFIGCCPYLTPAPQSKSSGFEVSDEGNNAAHAPLVQ